MSIEKLADGGERFNAVVTEVLADNSGPGDEHIENHKNEEDSEEALADFEGDFFDEAGEKWVDDFDEDEAKESPDEHDWNGGAAAEAAELARVIPGGGTGEGFLEKAETIFNGTTDKGREDENLPVFKFFAKEHPAHKRSTKAIDDVEGTPDDAAVGHPDAGAGFEIGLAVDEEVFVDGAKNGTDNKDEEEFFEGEPFGKGALCRRFGRFGSGGFQGFSRLFDGFCGSFALRGFLSFSSGLTRFSRHLRHLRGFHETFRVRIGRI